MIKRLFASLLIICCANFAYGDYITENVSGGCNNAFGDDLYAVFTPSQYTCSPGYYLPANHDGCVACPSGHTCPGGTYTFNETMAQGITYNIPISTNISYGCNNKLLAVDEMYAVFTPSQYNCAAGQYLPANAVACVQCPANSYCPGGTYTFDASATQGATACPTGYTSAAGATAQNQCYITVTGGHYIGTAGQNSTNWGTCAAGYAKAQHTVNYGSTSSCEQCTTDSVTGRPAYTDDAGGASSCSVCPAVTGELASRVTSYNYYPRNPNAGGINSCYAFFHDNDPTGYYGPLCYYNATDGGYGGEHSVCQSDVPVSCAAGYGSIIQEQPEWGGGNATWYGIDSMNGRVCGPCAAGTYSADGATSCTPCAVGYTSAAGASSCTANTITINWAGANGVFETGQCTYDGGISTPTTIPTKRGHVFAGWKFVE